MVDGVGWIEQCLSKLPKRRRVLNLDMSFIQFDASTRQGVIRLQYIPADVDTVVCLNNFDNARNCKAICLHAYDILPNDGIIIIVSNTIHPGLLRFSLKKFDWKYITVIPDRGELYAIAGKGEKPLILEKV
jgi:hypothetical protein